MTHGDSSDKPKDEDDFDFASFLDEKGEGAPPPSGTHEEPSGIEDDDFASFLSEGTKSEKKGPPPSGEHELPLNLDEDENELAAFLDVEEEPGKSLPPSGAQKLPISADDDDFATFLKSEDDVPVSAPGSEEDFEDFLKAEDSSAGKSATRQPFDEATEVIPAYSAAEEGHVGDSSLPTLSEMRVEPPTDTEDTFAVAGEDEEIEIEEEAVEAAPPRRGRSLVGTLGLLIVGGALGGGAGYAATKFLVADPMQLTIDEEKRAAGAARLEVKHNKGMLEGVRAENDKFKTELEKATQELNDAKTKAFHAKKEADTAKKEAKAAAGGGEQLAKLQQESELLKTQLASAAQTAGAAQKAQAAAEAAAKDALTKLEDAQKAAPAATAPAAGNTEAQAKLAETEKSLQAANAQVDELHAKLRDLEAKVARAESTPAATPESAAPVSDKSAELAAANEKVAELESKIKELEALPDAAPAVAAPADDTKLVDATAKIEELEAKIKDLESQPVVAAPADDTKLADATAKIAELEAKIKDLESQPAAEVASTPLSPPAPIDNSADVQEELAKSNRELADAKDQLKAARGLLASAQKELAAAKDGKAPSLYVPPKGDAANLGVSLQAYHRGLHDYFLGDYKAAAAALTDAVDSYPRDARYYYFRALALRRTGEMDKAVEDAKTGWALERQEIPTAYEISQALERIQGGDRRWLATQRNANASR